MLDIFILVAMAATLLLIPVGLPGLWIMTGIGVLAFFLGRLGFATVLILAALASSAELLEFLVLKRISTRYGGSTAVFWGAVAGGLAGALIGVPIPLLGPVIAGLAGTFLGAAAVASWQGARLVESGRIGWGTLLGRLAAMGLKGVLGFAMVLAAAMALLGG